MTMGKGGVGKTTVAVSLAVVFFGLQVTNLDFSRANPEPKAWFRGVIQRSAASGSSSTKRLLTL